MSKEVITINKGFQIVERKYTVDAGFAAKVLSSSKQFKYTQAEYKQATDTVELIRHICICANCGFQMPSYHSFYHDYEPPRKLVTKKFAAEWCGDIRTFFDTEDKILPLYKPYFPNEFTCPECGSKSPLSSQTEEIVFDKEKSLLKLSCNIETIDEIFATEWVPTFTINTLPLVENIVFNFEKGRTFFEIRTPEGELVCARDVTNSLPVENQTSKLTNLINKNVFVKSKLKHYFNEMWGAKIPLSKNELNLTQFIQLVSYIGYPKEFYYNIPSDDFNLTFNTLFKNARKKLHNSSNCIKLIEKSKLPKTKSVKKTLFTYPDLFFYLNELERMWEIFKDNNLFCRFLYTRNARANLHMLYMYPKIIDFYEDFVHAKGTLELFKLITLFEDKACKYGIHYSVCSEKQKLLEQRRWKNFKHTKDYIRLSPEINISGFFVKDNDSLVEFKDQTCNGYMFSVLQARNQFLIAGEQLKNCLKSYYNYRDCLVVGVLKHGKYVAAIEVDVRDNTVLQALICNNEEIEEDKNVFMAFKKWCKVNKICYKKREFPNVEAF